MAGQSFLCSVAVVVLGISVSDCAVTLALEPLCQRRSLLGPEHRHLSLGQILCS